jgi:cytochrome c-type biogenesis protein CcmF
VALGTVVAVAVIALGVPIWASGICFALSGFVFGTISQEFWRGTRVRQNATGTDAFTALVGLVGRNKRRYGGYIVHLGIVLLFLGFAGEGFKQTQLALLKPGQQIQLGDFVVRHDALHVTNDAQKQMVSSEISVFKDGQPFATMYPAKWFWQKSAQPTTEVAIRRGFAEDVYVVLANFDTASQTATLEVTIAPLVNWVWFGFGILALGTIIALLPETAFAFATIKVPSAAATTTPLLLLALVLSPGLALAQTTGEVVQKTALQDELEDEIMCSCGGCRSSVKDCPMLNCHGETAQTQKLQAMIAKGMTRQEIIDAFVRDFGSEDILMRPRDQGFNRLAWLFPYVAAVTAFVAVFFAARRWARPATPAIAGGAGIDPELNARLDDELRDLD